MRLNVITVFNRLRMGGLCSNNLLINVLYVLVVRNFIFSGPLCIYSVFCVHISIYTIGDYSFISCGVNSEVSSVKVVICCYR